MTHHILTEQRNCEILKLLHIYAYIQEYSKIKIYVDIYVIYVPLGTFSILLSDILKTSTQNGKELVKHITLVIYGRQEGSFTVSHI